MKQSIRCIERDTGNSATLLGDIKAAIWLWRSLLRSLQLVQLKKRNRGDAGTSISF